MLLVLVLHAAEHDEGAPHFKNPHKLRFVAQQHSQSNMLLLWQTKKEKTYGPTATTVQFIFVQKTHIFFQTTLNINHPQQPSQQYMWSMWTQTTSKITVSFLTTLNIKIPKANLEKEWSKRVQKVEWSLKLLSTSRFPRQTSKRNHQNMSKKSNDLSNNPQHQQSKSSLQNHIYFEASLKQVPTSAVPKPTAKRIKLCRKMISNNSPHQHSRRKPQRPHCFWSISQTHNSQINSPKENIEKLSTNHAKWSLKQLPTSTLKKQPLTTCNFWHKLIWNLILEKIYQTSTCTFVFARQSARKLLRNFKLETGSLTEVSSKLLGYVGQQYAQK